MEFELAKETYRKARLNEREKIRQALSELHFDIFDGPNAGHGPLNYPMRSNRIHPKLDLRNWMWVEGIHRADSSVRVLVTLQVLDWDPSTRNAHSLFDRLGVIPAVEGIHPKLHPGARGPISTTNTEADNWVREAVLLEQFHTDIDLPLTSVKLTRLKEIVADRCGIELENK
ncbi:hypothetical protein ACTOVL_04260 [Arcanobacterium canis]